MSLRQTITAGTSAVAAVLLCIMSPAAAAPILIDFEGIADQASIQTYYGSEADGSDGSDSAGNSGPDLGVTFSDSVIALQEFQFDGSGGTGDIENQPSGTNVMYLLYDPTQLPDADDNTNPDNVATGILNFADGFAGAFSFFYSASTETTIIPQVTLYDQIGGIGTALLTFSLTLNWQADGCDTLNGEYCNWDFVQEAFAGIARSIVFTGATNRIGFDDITINPVPLPAGIWFLISGLAGIAAVRRRRTTH